MKKKFICIVAAVLVAALAIGGGKLYFGPDRCPLCKFIKSHAPCIVNVATGEVEEMALYTPHYKLVGEIAEEQNDSTFSFVNMAGARGTRISSPWIMELDVPVTKAPLFKHHFCRDCRKLLADQSGYVIADLYVPGTPIIIPSSVYTQYEKQIAKMKEILSKKTVWGTMSKREQTTIENVILLVGMLFKLCKIELIVKKNKAEVICSEEIKNIGTEVDALLKRTKPWWQFV